MVSLCTLFCSILLVVSLSARRKDCNCFDLTLTATQRNPRSNQICYSYQVSRRLTTNYCMGLDLSSFMLGTGQCSVQQRDRVLIDYEPSDLVIGYKSKPFNSLSMERMVMAPQSDKDRVYDTYKLCFDSSSVGQLRKSSKVAWKFSSGDMTQCNLRLTLPNFCVTPSPTPMPTDSPTVNPTPFPTDSPTTNPTSSPTPNPTTYPTDNPVEATGGDGCYFTVVTTGGNCEWFSIPYQSRVEMVISTQPTLWSIADAADNELAATSLSSITLDNALNADIGYQVCVEGTFPAYYITISCLD